MSAISDGIKPGDKTFRFRRFKRPKPEVKKETSIVTIPDTPDLLVVVVDANSALWGAVRPKLDFEEVVNALLIFVNAYLAIKPGNRIALIAATASGGKFLYPPPDLERLPGFRAIIEKPDITEYASPEILNGNNANANYSNIRRDSYTLFKKIDSQVFDCLKRSVLESTTIEKVDGSSVNKEIDVEMDIASTMSLALSYINRVTNEVEEGALNSRILCLSISPDAPIQYVKMMNFMFAAQRINTKLDICTFSNLISKPSIFLSQGCYVTGGISKTVTETKGLLQYFLHVFLPEIEIRGILELPLNEEVDFRAACFCHKKVVDIGFVCTICLSIFCKKLPSCPTCSTLYTEVETSL